MVDIKNVALNGFKALGFFKNDPKPIQSVESQKISAEIRADLKEKFSGEIPKEIQEILDDQETPGELEKILYHLKGSQPGQLRGKR